MREMKNPIKRKPKAFGLSYLVNEHPPWYLCIWLAFQVRERKAYNVFVFKFNVVNSSSKSFNPRTLMILNGMPTLRISLLNIALIFSAFPNHVGINIGDSLHPSNSNVF